MWEHGLPLTVEECTEKLQTAQKVRHQLFVSGYAGKYFPALYFCVGTRLLDALCLDVF